MAILVIFGLYFMLVSPEENDVLLMVELRSFAVFANFRLQPSFYNLILKFLPRIRPLQDGRTSEDENFPDQGRGRGRYFFNLDALGRGRRRSRVTNRENF